MSGKPHDLFGAMVEERWIALTTQEVASATMGPGGLTIGPVVFGPAAQVTLQGDRLSILRDGWRLETYLRYRPLVYFAAFGAPDIFACLQLAMTSLFEFGEYAGEVLLLTDAAHLSWAECLPPAWRERVRAQALTGADTLDWTLARYRVVDMPELQRYRPFLYLDMDMICNAPLEALLRRLAVSTTLHAPAENHLMRPENWYGASLFAADGVALPVERAAFSTGMLGFPDLATVRALFTTIPRLAEGYARAVGNRAVFDCFDQPFANYAVVKAGTCEMALLGQFLENRHFWHERSPVRRGLTHFTGGTHTARQKLPAMASYVEQLRATRQR